MEEDIKIFNQCIESLKEFGQHNLSLFSNTPFEGKLETIELIFNKAIARNKELQEDNYAYHQLMQMQNKREYRSKFLKDFKAEYGENVMPDYDEIYKRYDKMKRRIQELEKENKNLNIIRLEYLVSQFPDTTETYKKYKKELKELLQEGDK